ncbi:MAG: glycoside hydrolase family 97 N-terminal domain-containing protein, partial [Rubrivivax sp.]|nr:glycoside hydrolase family 97 N-terminal domain-containing protein [Rubrivivax sp.]
MSHFQATRPGICVRQAARPDVPTPIRCALFCLPGLILVLAACSAVPPGHPVGLPAPTTVPPAPLAAATGTPFPTFTPLPTATPTPIDGLEVRSPDGRIQVFLCVDGGVPFYQVRYDGREVLLPSKLGLVFRDTEPLNHDLYVDSVERRTVDETWTQPWGEAKTVRDHYNELRAVLQEGVGAARRMVIVFRVYDDGLGFRYELPQQPHLSHFELVDEETEFALAGNHIAWWIPAYGRDRYEYLYQKSALNTWEWSSVRAVHTPLTMQTADGLYLCIHEAALIDYAAMTLALARRNTLTCDLVPWSDGVKVRGTTPHQSPWRTIQIAAQPGDLITSRLILNLNEPNRLPDVSWIHPGKYVGIWW